MAGKLIRFFFDFLSPPPPPFGTEKYGQQNKLAGMARKLIRTNFLDEMTRIIVRNNFRILGPPNPRAQIQWGNKKTVLAS